MIFHSSTTTTEFLDWLRDSAIKGGMPPAFIDMIDELHELEPANEEQDAELSKLQEEVDELQSDKADLLVELEALVTATYVDNMDDKELIDGRKAAEHAITRHSK